MLPFIYLLAASSATADPLAAAVIPVPPIYTVPAPIPAPMRFPPPPPPPPPLRPTSDKSRPARPANSPGSWVTQDDYPDQAIRAKKSGTTGFRVDVDTDGLVHSCTITFSSGSDLLDAMACQKVTERATFEPALDKKGRVANSTYSNSVRWTLPEWDISLPWPGMTIQNYSVDKNGWVTSCRERDMSDESSKWYDCIDNIPLSYIPYRDEQGNPVPVRVSVSTSVRVTEIKPDADKGDDKK